MTANTFDYILTVDSLPKDLKNCSFTSEQAECSILVRWTQNPNRTAITLTAGGERKIVSDQHNLDNRIILKNTGTKIEWTKSITYICSTERCNSLTTLKRLLQSLRLEDSFHTLSPLLAINNQFDGKFCHFFANSSVPCETEMDPTTCKQCATQEYIQSKSVEVCLNCINETIIENFITRQVKFFLDNRERHDLWMIECQQKDCNAIETGDLIRQKSIIEFNFDRFLNNGSHQQTSLSFIGSILLILIVMKIVHYDH